MRTKVEKRRVRQDPPTALLSPVVNDHPAPLSVQGHADVSVPSALPSAAFSTTTGDTHPDGDVRAVSISEAERLAASNHVVVALGPPVIVGPSRLIFDRKGEVQGGVVGGGGDGIAHVLAGGLNKVSVQPANSGEDNVIKKPPKKRRNNEKKVEVVVDSSEKKVEVALDLSTTSSMHSTCGKELQQHPALTDTVIIPSSLPTQLQHPPITPPTPSPQHPLTCSPQHVALHNSALLCRSPPNPSPLLQQTPPSSSEPVLMDMGGDPMDLMHTGDGTDLHASPEEGASLRQFIMSESEGLALAAQSNVVLPLSQSHQDQVPSLVQQPEAIQTLDAGEGELSSATSTSLLQPPTWLLTPQEHPPRLEGSEHESLAASNQRTVQAASAPPSLQEASSQPPLSSSPTKASKKAGKKTASKSKSAKNKKKAEDGLEQSGEKPEESGGDSAVISDCTDHTVTSSLSVDSAVTAVVSADSVVTASVSADSAVTASVCTSSAVTTCVSTSSAVTSSLSTSSAVTVSVSSVADSAHIPMQKGSSTHTESTKSTARSEKPQKKKPKAGDENSEARLKQIEESIHSVIARYVYNSDYVSDDLFHKLRQAAREADAKAESVQHEKTANSNVAMETAAAAVTCNDRVASTSVEVRVESQHGTNSSEVGVSSEPVKPKKKAAAKKKKSEPKIAASKESGEGESALGGEGTVEAQTTSPKKKPKKSKKAKESAVDSKNKEEPLTTDTATADARPKETSEAQPKSTTQDEVKPPPAKKRKKSSKKKEVSTTEPAADSQPPPVNAVPNGHMETAPPQDTPKAAKKKRSKSKSKKESQAEDKVSVNMAIPNGSEAPEAMDTTVGADPSQPGDKEKEADKPQAKPKPKKAKKRKREESTEKKDAEKSKDEATSEQHKDGSEGNKDEASAETKAGDEPSKPPPKKKRKKEPKEGETAEPKKRKSPSKSKKAKQSKDASQNTDLSVLQNSLPNSQDAGNAGEAKSSESGEIKPTEEAGTSTEEGQETKSTPTVEKKVKKTLDEVICPDCGHKTRGQAALSRHMKKMHEKSVVLPYPCPKQPDCEYSASKVSLLARHMLTHGLYMCSRCQFTVDTKDKYEEHLQSEHNVKLDCKLCKKCSRYVKCDTVPLEKHLEVCQGPVPFTCDVCGKQFKYESSLKVHHHTHFPDQPKLYHCTQCEYASNYRANLHKHVQNMHVQRPRDIKCKLCDKMFSTEDNMRRHMKIHTQVRPFKCHKCEKAFKSQCALRGHVVSHEVARPYKCNIDNCQREFRTPKFLKSHQEEFHRLIPKKYHCKVEGCGFSFFKLSHLKRHEISHTGERNFHCDHPGCGKSFRHADNLKVHLRQHTNERPIRCPQCKFTCRQKSSLQWHLKRDHNQSLSLDGLDNTKVNEVIIPLDGKPLEGFTLPEGMTFPEGFKLPEGFTLPEGVKLPEGMDLAEGVEVVELEKINVIIPAGEGEELPVTITELRSMDMYDFHSDNDSSDEATPGVFKRDKTKMASAAPLPPAPKELLMKNAVFDVLDDSFKTKVEEPSKPKKKKTPSKKAAKPKEPVSKEGEETKKEGGEETAAAAADEEKTKKKKKKSTTPKKANPEASTSPKKTNPEGKKKSTTPKKKKKAAKQETTEEKDNKEKDCKETQENQGKEAAKADGEEGDSPQAETESPAKPPPAETKSPAKPKKSPAKKKTPTKAAAAVVAATAAEAAAEEEAVEEKEKPAKTKAPAKGKKSPKTRASPKKPTSPKGKPAAKTATRKTPPRKAATAKKGGKAGGKKTATKKGAAKKKTAAKKKAPAKKKTTKKGKDKEEKVAEEENDKKEEIEEQTVAPEPKPKETPAQVSRPQITRRARETRNSLAAAEEASSPMRPSSPIDSEEENMPQGAGSPYREFDSQDMDDSSPEPRDSPSPPPSPPRVEEQPAPSPAADLEGSTKEGEEDAMPEMAEAQEEAEVSDSEDIMNDIPLTPPRAPAPPPQESSDEEEMIPSPPTHMPMSADTSDTAAPSSVLTDQPGSQAPDFQQPHSREEFQQPHSHQDFQQPHSREEFQQPLSQQPQSVEYPQHHSREEIIQPHSREEYPQHHSREEYHQPHSREDYSQPHSREEYAQPHSREEYPQPLSREEYPQPLSREEYPQPLSREEYSQPLSREEYPQPHSREEYSQPHSREDYSQQHSREEYPQSQSREEYSQQHSREDLQPQGSVPESMSEPVHSVPSEGLPEDVPMPHSVTQYDPVAVQTIPTSEAESAYQYLQGLAQSGEPISEPLAGEPSRLQQLEALAEKPHEDSGGVTDMVKSPVGGAPTGVITSLSPSATNLVISASETSSRRMEILSTDRPVDQALIRDSPSALPRLPDYDAFSALNPLTASAARDNGNLFPPPPSTPSFMRLTESDAMLQRQRMSTPFLPTGQPERSLSRLPESSLQPANPSALLRRPPSMADGMFSGAAGMPQAMPRNPFTNTWAGQDVRPPHWGQAPTYLQRPSNAPTTPFPFAPKDNYQFMFDPTVRPGMTDRNMFASLSGTQSQRDLASEASPFQLDRFDLSTYFGSHPYSGATGLDYSRTAVGATSKSFDERYRQTAVSMSEFRPLPPTTSTDMFSGIGVGVNSLNSASFNLDKYTMYGRDPMYHAAAQQLSDNTNSAFLTHAAPTQHSMFDRDYPHRSLYPHQNPAYPLFNDRQYPSAAKLTGHPTPSAMSHERDFMTRPSANDNQMQDPYRCGMLYNVVNRYPFE